MPQIYPGYYYLDRSGDIWGPVERIPNSSNETYKFRTQRVHDKIGNGGEEFTKNGRSTAGVESSRDLVKQLSSGFVPGPKMVLGSYYKTRGGKVVGPLTSSTNPSGGYPYIINGQSYTFNGNIFSYRFDQLDDLVEITEALGEVEGKQPEEPDPIVTTNEERTVEAMPDFTATNTLLRIRSQSYTSEDGRTISFEPIDPTTMPFRMSHDVKIDGLHVAFVSEANKVDERLAETFLRLFPYRVPRDNNSIL